MIQLEKNPSGRTLLRHQEYLAIRLWHHLAGVLGLHDHPARLIAVDQILSGIPARLKGTFRTLRESYLPPLFTFVILVFLDPLEDPEGSRDQGSDEHDYAEDENLGFSLLRAIISV